MASAPLLITEEPALGELVTRLRSAERYAVDTEFHRERSYWPHLALLQVAWPPTLEEAGGVALVDPLAVDVAPLRAVLEGPGVMVAHAAEQDLEILERRCGRGPSRLLDTQVAAGFAGHGSASLASLTQIFLGTETPKADRLTDWRLRPLSDSQVAYAAADVENLLDLADAILRRLDERGRRRWAEEECETVLARERGPGDPYRAWWKLRDARSLRGSARGVAREVAAWRELRARALDQPLRSVLPDLAIQAIAQRPPASADDLARMRGLDGRHLRPSVAADILDAVARGRAVDAAGIEQPPADEVPRELRAPVALVMAWVTQLARDEHLDPALLATRGDVGAYLRGEPGSRLAGGWREALLGGPIRAIVAGEAAICFDGAGRLAIEERSRRPLSRASRPGAGGPPSG